MPLNGSPDITPFGGEPGPPVQPAPGAGQGRAGKAREAEPPPQPSPGPQADQGNGPGAAEPLAARDLTVAYGDDPPLLEGMTFSARRGEILGILGPSGCGKSSLLRHLVGLSSPRAGVVRLFGEDIFAEGEKSLARARRRFGIMYQGGALFGDMNLLENVSMPLREFTRMPPAAQESAAALKLALVGLSGFERHMPSEISGGMRKRAAIARAMALEPGLLFLDEPSAGLDPVTAASLDGLIISLSRNLGITFVMVTHELRSIMRAVDRAILLDKRKRGIAAQGAPKFLAEESDAPEARAFFLRG
ncbi:MAG: ATP-binding cassette domain-containing protein [Deltaproteobacteria bacterium]|nr:ATP-binding cassette domain-containing protein [Deltaproteobacteria bacterium]